MEQDRKTVSALEHEQGSKRMGTTTRRNILRTAGAAGLALAMGKTSLFAGEPQKRKRPNVLFISIDDLNTWTGCLGGHPGAKTPNLDRAAARGVLFTNAFCSAPGCNPSRTSVLTGIHASTSGVYKNTQPFRQSPVLKNAVTLPKVFMNHGYKTMGAGKIFHFEDPDSWNEFKTWSEFHAPANMQPRKKLRPLNGIPEIKPFDWGPINSRPEDMTDWMISDWVANKLQQEYKKSFFLACGFLKPHTPWYVPKKYFDMHPLNKIVLPEVNPSDLNDIPAAATASVLRNAHAAILGHGKWRSAVQAYLANISFMDECLGRVLDSLDNSRYRDNTAVVIWSDNGFHLGEKGVWRKNTLWKESTQCFLSISAPGVTAPGGKCESPVGLIDIYSTLTDICGMGVKKRTESVSLRPLLKDPGTPWNRPTLMSSGDNNAIRYYNWRYIRYSDGSEELYNLLADEKEFHNLAVNKNYLSTLVFLRKMLPEKNAPFSPEGYNHPDDGE